MISFFDITKIKRSTWLPVVLLAVIYVGILAAFFLMKSSFKGFTLERIFRDTLSYVQVAEQPFFSSGFWAAERPFTLPLAYKILGVTSRNFELPGTMAQVSAFQTWFSALSWILLGWAAALQFRSRWIRPLSFAVVLLFSTTLQVSFWDSLMLSESLSISLFSGVCAGWLFWIWFIRSSHDSILGWLLIALQILVTILYTFIRDSNIYFVIIGGLLITACIFWSKGIYRLQKVQAGVYGAAILAVLFASNLNISQGNRWQVFVYDQLALNILPDPAARDFFAQSGLVVDAKLMAITSMVGYQYQNLLANDPEMAGVRQWVEEKGKTTYLQYLLANGLNSLSEPIVKAKALLNPNTTGYLYPRFPGLPYPRRVTLVSQVLYPDNIVFAVAIFIWVMLVGVLIWWRSGFQISAWWFSLVLVASLYPLMFLIWHGEPMEVDRHAAQLGIQLRLAAWLSLVLFAEYIVLAWKNHRKQNSNPGEISAV